MITVLVLVLVGVLVATTLAVITLYWDRTRLRKHVVGISVSYMLLTVLAAQPTLEVLDVQLWPSAHVAVLIAAAGAGIAALWLMVREVAKEHGEDAGEQGRRGGVP